MGPIPILLWCPQCGERHIDEGEYAAKPHHTHACQHCGLCWRPAVVPTVGVKFLPGFKNPDPTSGPCEEGRPSREGGRPSSHVVTDPEAVVRSWTDEQLAEALEWAAREHLAAGDNDDVGRVPCPPHVRALRGGRRWRRMRC